MANEKELKVVLADNSGTLYSIQYEGGGQVPEYLKGVFTNRTMANQAIKSYLTNHKRGTRNGKTTS